MCLMMNVMSGSVVRYAKPVDAVEAGLRFVVVESYDGRAHIRCVNLAGWNEALAPVETVSVDELELVN